MTDLEKAILISLEKHMGQTDVSSQPYILHPLRVMLNMNTEDEMIVAILHDTLEDTDLSLEELVEEGFASAVIDAIQAITHNVGEAYDDYIYRVSQNELAKNVKLEDLKDNMNLRRIKDFEDYDFSKLRKYRRAWSILTGK